MTPFASALIVYVGIADDQIARLHAVKESLNRSTRPDALVVKVAANQKMAQFLIREEIPDLLLVETDSNQESRMAFCQWMGDLSPDTQIVTTGKLKPRKSSGDDEFLPMPLGRTATVDLVERLLTIHQKQVTQLGAIHLHRTRRMVEGPVGRHKLPPKQADLLTIFMQNPDTTITRQELMSQAWQTDYMSDTRTLDVHIRWLREMIEPTPSKPIYLQTVRGVGYRFCPDGVAG